MPVPLFRVPVLCNGTTQRHARFNAIDGSSGREPQLTREDKDKNILTSMEQYPLFRLFFGHPRRCRAEQASTLRVTMVSVPQLCGELSSSSSPAVVAPGGCLSSTTPAIITASPTTWPNPLPACQLVRVATLLLSAKYPRWPASLESLSTGIPMFTHHHGLYHRNASGIDLHLQAVSDIVLRCMLPGTRVLLFDIFIYHEFEPLHLKTRQLLSVLHDHDGISLTKIQWAMVHQDHGSL
ncbi:hypothetical protein QBC45DRAFT_430272 [Copromyces sp. CBS 386.78]|nr:hypothetical protein QBC45DRAFT_430272 [Copromyces sp. CBS 386.78]